MQDKVKEAKNIEELIYSLEPLCYYYEMKPNEFWNCTFREVNMYIKANTIRYFDDVRMQITIQEAVTSKMIKSNPICNKRPKVINLRDTFKGLFEKNK